MIMAQTFPPWTWEKQRTNRIPVRDQPLLSAALCFKILLAKVHSKRAAMSNEPEVETKITRLLAQPDGAACSADDLLPLVYDQLRSLARAKLAREAPGHTLQPTALVHEAYVRVAGEHDPGWSNRGHFFGAAAQAMRRILVDQARHKKRQKRGGDRQREPLVESQLAIELPGNDDLVAIDEALGRLESEDPRKGQIVNLRYFVGMTTQETAEALGISVSTVEREWRYCRRWLYAELADDPS